VDYCRFSDRDFIFGQYARSKTATKFLDSSPTTGYNKTSKVVFKHNGFGGFQVYWNGIFSSSEV